MSPARSFQRENAEGGRSRSRRKHRGAHGAPPAGRALSSVLLGGAFALILLGLAAPRLMAAAQVAEYGTVGERLGRGEISGAELSNAASAHREALAWLDSGLYHGDLGQLYFAMARLHDDPARRRALLERAAAYDSAALQREPGQPFLWTQLAAARAQTRGMDAEFLRVLRLAIETAPRTRQLIFARADLGLRAWPLLDEAARQRVREQIVQAVRLEPARLRRHLPGPNHRRLVRHLLAEDPAMVERFLRD